MKAVVLKKYGKIDSSPLAYIDIPRPIPAEGQVLLKIKACGVCRSNLHMIEGDWQGSPSEFPMIPGHEAIGVVEELGKNAKNIKIGDTVGVQPLFKSCLKCEYCNLGEENRCIGTKNFTGESVNGGFAEYMVADSDFVYKIPEKLDPIEAAPLLCAGITAYKAVKYAELSRKKTIAIYGIGGLGHAAIQFARLYGSKIIAVSRSKEHLKLAKELGASVETEVNNVDSAIVFSPAPEAVEAAFNSLKPGGILVVAVNLGVPAFVPWGEKIVKGVAIGSRKDVHEVLDIAAAGKIKMKTQTFRLSEANEVLRKMKYSEFSGRAVLVP